MPAPFTGPEGPHGEHLELQTSLSWPKNFSPSPAFIKSLLCRMRACAHRSPDLLPIYGISRASLSNLTAAAKCLFSHEGNVLFAPIPPESTLHVIGDIHGDVFSLLSALSITGLPSPDNKLVFAGDFVDRGPWGCETLACVFALKCAFPDFVFLIRGNHETSYCTEQFGFETECSRKYGPSAYKNFLSAFRHLPLATVTQSLLPAPKACKKQKKKDASPPAKRARASSAFPWDEELQVGERRVLVVHGGLWRAFEKPGSMALGTLTQIAKMPHPGDDPKESAASDVLWSDPTCSEAGKGVRKNSLRGEGVLYGFGAIDAFLKANKLCAMIRAHEGPDARKVRPEMNHMNDGYSIDSDNCFTVFSAARYVDHNNRGAVATFEGRRSSASLAPKFTSFDCENKPTNPTVFTKPSSIDRPVTPAYQH